MDSALSPAVSPGRPVRDARHAPRRGIHVRDGVHARDRDRARVRRTWLCQRSVPSRMARAGQRRRVPCRSGVCTVGGTRGRRTIAGSLSPHRRERPHRRLRGLRRRVRAREHRKGSAPPRIRAQGPLRQRQLLSGAQDSVADGDRATAAGAVGDTGGRDFAQSVADHLCGRPPDHRPHGVAGWTGDDSGRRHGAGVHGTQHGHGRVCTALGCGAAARARPGPRGRRGRARVLCQRRRPRNARHVARGECVGAQHTGRAVPVIRWRAGLVAQPVEHHQRRRRSAAREFGSDPRPRRHRRAGLARAHVRECRQPASGPQPPPSSRDRDSSGTRRKSRPSRPTTAHGRTGPRVDGGRPGVWRRGVGAQAHGAGRRGSSGVGVRRRLARGDRHGPHRGHRLRDGLAGAGAASDPRCVAWQRGDGHSADERTQGRHARGADHHRDRADPQRDADRARHSIRRHRAIRLRPHVHDGRTARVAARCEADQRPTEGLSRRPAGCRRRKRPPDWPGDAGTGDERGRLEHQRS